MADQRGPIKKLEDAITGHGGHGIGDKEEREKDFAYSPASEREMQESQDDQRSDAELRADGIDPSKIIAAPGTGGVDDAGDVEPEEGDLNLPWQQGEGTTPR